MSRAEEEPEARDAWSASSDPPALAAGEVHVWRVLPRADPERADVERWSAHVSAGERALADRKHFARDRDEVLVSHGVLRVVLARYLGVAPASLAFQTGEHGKPALDPNPGRLAFNLSHSGGGVLIGVAREVEIGVDVERRDRVASDDLAERVLSERELACWAEVPAAERRELFLRVWTGKEAVLKASGAGLSIDPRAFDVLAPRTGRDGWELARDVRLSASERRTDTGRFALRELDFAVNCAAALAVAGALPSVRCFDAPVDWAG